MPVNYEVLRKLNEMDFGVGSGSRTLAEAINDKLGTYCLGYPKYYVEKGQVEEWLRQGIEVPTVAHLDALCIIAVEKGIDPHKLYTPDLRGYVDEGDKQKCLCQGLAKHFGENLELLKKKRKKRL